MREDLVLSVAESIDKARRAGFMLTIRQAEFALIIDLTDDERQAIKDLLTDAGHLMGVGF